MVDMRSKDLMMRVGIDTLEDTIRQMASSDYKERFKAEYYQLVLRYDKLASMVQAWDNGRLDFEPDCPRSLYTLQLRAMADYIAVLEARAKIENIIL